MTHADDFEGSTAVVGEVGLRPQDRYSNHRSHPLMVDSTFCTFKVPAPQASGVYGWFVDGELVYVGRAKDLRNRLSAQYGRVSPRHPYRGGQIQKCRLNSRINNALAAGQRVEVKWLPTTDYFAMEQLLLATHRPPWNIR